MSGNAAGQGFVESWQYLILEHERGGPTELARQCNELGACLDKQQGMGESGCGARAGRGKLQEPQGRRPATER